MELAPYTILKQTIGTRWYNAFSTTTCGSERERVCVELYMVPTP